MGPRITMDLLFLKKIFVHLSMTLEIGSFGFNMIISVSGDYGDDLGDAGGPWCSNPALWTDASS